jgi:hypothetical protein
LGFPNSFSAITLSTASVRLSSGRRTHRGRAPSGVVPAERHPFGGGGKPVHPRLAWSPLWWTRRFGAIGRNPERRVGSRPIINSVPFGESGWCGPSAEQSIWRFFYSPPCSAASSDVASRKGGWCIVGLCCHPVDGSSLWWLASTGSCPEAGRCHLHSWGCGRGGCSRRAPWACPMTQLGFPGVSPSGGASAGLQSAGFATGCYGSSEWRNIG